MKKILVFLGVIAMTMLMSSCFGPCFWDEPYGPPAPHHGGYGPVHAQPRPYYHY